MTLTFYALLPDQIDRLKSSWTIFTQKDINDLQDTKLFENELQKVKDTFVGYLFDAGRFGSIIDVKKKGEFIEAIDKLKKDFKSYLKKDEKNEGALKRFETENKKADLKAVLEKSRKELEKYLLQLCPKTNAFLSVIFEIRKDLKLDYENGCKEKEKVLEEFVRSFVLNKLKFTDVNEIINRIDIKLDFYDISDELLFNNEEFMEIIKKYDLEPRVNSEGFEGGA